MTTVGERLALPGEEAYEAATRVFNLHAPAEPAAAVTARTVEQVRAAVRHAASVGLGVRVHATGHASSAARPMAGAVLIRTELGGVDVDPERRLARVPAGTPWAEVVHAAAAHGLAAPHGSSPTVGVVGFVLRGGVSFYSRRVGLAAGGVRAIELVTADGEAHRVDATTDPELFWALRGGGGGLGVVTAVEIGLFPMARVVTGAAFWTAEHADRLLAAWRAWAADAPAEAATSLRVMNLPKIPEIPPALTAGPVLCVAGVVASPTADDLPAARRQAEELLAPLRSIAEPVVDTWQTAAPAAVLATHMDPTEPITVLGDHLLLRELGDDGSAELLRVACDPVSPLVAVELRQLGGAASVPDPAGGALDHLDAAYACMAAGLPGETGTAAAIRDHCARLRAALAPWDTGRTAPTFVENVDQPQGHLDAERVAAVDRVRQRVDPDGLFRGDVSPGASALA